VDAKLHTEIEMKSYFSSEVSDLILGLTKKDATERLGCGEKGIGELKNHPFFKKINWKKMLKK